MQFRLHMLHDQIDDEHISYESLKEFLILWWWVCSFFLFLLFFYKISALLEFLWNIIKADRSRFKKILGDWFYVDLLSLFSFYIFSTISLHSPNLQKQKLKAKTQTNQRLFEFISFFRVYTEIPSIHILYR